MDDTSQVMRSLIAQGISFVPISLDGSKQPAWRVLPKQWDEAEQRMKSTWKPLQWRFPTDAEIKRWNGYGVGAVCGAISGNLEIFDCDDAELFDPWCEAVEALCPGLLAKLVIIRTPSGGFHVYYRCPEISGSLKLARKAVEDLEGTEDAKLIDGKWVLIKTTLETRGEGAYALAPGSPGACHPSGGRYTFRFGSLSNIPTITPQERAVMQDAARSLNQYVERERVYKPSSRLFSDQSNRPGDDYNSNGDWYSLLTSHGWRFVFSRGEVSYWRRPGKPAPGISATTNYRGSNLLYVFSSNAHPFDERAGYSLFAAFAMLEFGGDFHTAAKALAGQGYGSRRRRKATVPAVLKPISKPQNTIILESPKRPTNTIKLPTPTRPAVTTILTVEVAR
jgi:hypothetical protein